MSTSEAGRIAASTLSAGYYPSLERMPGHTQEYWLAQGQHLVDKIEPLIRAQVVEEIAQAIEVSVGDRCPECLGKAASTKWTPGRYEKTGRCGAGHTWVLRSGDWQSAVDVARGTANGYQTR